VPRLQLPEPYAFELSTARYRAFGTDLANLWHEGGLHRVVGGREVRITAAPGGVEVEPHDAEIERVVLKLLGTEFDLDALTLEERPDQFLEPARHDVDVPAFGLRSADEVAEPRADPRLLERPGDHLLERRRDGLELAGDHFPQRKTPTVEARLDLVVDRGVAELERGAVEEIGHRDGAVEVEHDRPLLLFHFRLCSVTHA